MAGYLGSVPVPQATQHRETFTATAGQTTFNTAGYTPLFIDVYLNGVHLSPADITATNGSDVVLGACVVDDIVDVVSYTPFEVASQTFTGTTTMTDVVAASLDISGDIDIDGTTNLDIVDIDGAVNIATTALVTGILTTTAATVFNGGFTSNNNALMAGSNKLLFRDGALFINSSGDGQLDIDADTELELTAPTIQLVASTKVDLDGNLDVSGTALVTGVLTTTAATVFNGGFAANAASTITTSDNTNNLTLICTDADANSGPIMDFYRNSASPADGDSIGIFQFIGRNDNSQDVTAVQIETKMTDVSDGNEDASFSIGIRRAGAFVDALSFDPTEVVFNDSDADINFRVESSGEASMLFVDAGTNTVQVGTAADPAAGSFNSPALYVKGDTAGVSGIAHFEAQANDSLMTLGHITGGDFNFRNSYRSNGAFTDIEFIDVGGNSAFRVGMKSVSAESVFNEDDEDHDFRVESVDHAHMFHVDAAFNSVGIGIAAVNNILLYVDAPAGQHPMVARTQTAGTASIVFDNTDSSGTRNFASFRISNVEKGAITSTGSVMVYGGTSDYRLKENVVNLTGATNRLKQLRPKRFNFIGDTETIDGFLAHEVDAVVPAAVVGEKDAVDENGEVDAQQMDNGHLVPLLVATIQELEARITALEA